jgi:hypothetical protein
MSGPPNPPKLLTGVVGVDPGGRQDYWGIAAVLKYRQGTPREPQELPQSSLPNWAWMPSDGPRPQPPMKWTDFYHVVGLDRLRGDNYRGAVERACWWLRELKERYHLSPRLVLDSTGVGNAVAAMFRDEGVRPVRITFSGGHKVVGEGLEVTVPKQDLVAQLGVLLNTGRLKVGRELGLARALLTELKMFRVRTNAQTRHESFEAEGTTHDDLTCALAVAVWKAEQHRPFLIA